MKFRDEKIESALAKLAAEFIRLEAGPTSLITVTAVHFEDRANRAKIFVTVLPDKAEDGALKFLNRRLSDLREYVKERIRMRAVPMFSFAIDSGEKNRQRIDELAK